MQLQICITWIQILTLKRKLSNKKISMSPQSTWHWQTICTKPKSKYNAHTLLWCVVRIHWIATKHAHPWCWWYWYYVHQQWAGSRRSAVNGGNVLCYHAFRSCAFYIDPIPAIGSSYKPGFVPTWGCGWELSPREDERHCMWQVDCLQALEMAHAM